MGSNPTSTAGQPIGPSWRQLSDHSTQSEGVQLATRPGRTWILAIVLIREEGAYTLHEGRLRLLARETGLGLTLEGLGPRPASLASAVRRGPLAERPATRLHAQTGASLLPPRP